MKRSFGVIAGVLLLLVVGALCLIAGLFERRMAIAQEDMVVLDFVDPQAEYAELQQQLERVPWVSEGPLREIRRRRALLQYWQGEYGDLAEIARTAAQEDQLGDPEIQFMAANALYRVAQEGPKDRPTILKNLDAAIRAYSDAIRAGSDRPDTSFNYELVVRMREEIASGRRRGGLPTVEELKDDMHGEEGEPPKDMEVEQFQIRIPMDPSEVKSQQDTAGTGQQRRRRG
jgi:hypothetical protein